MTVWMLASVVALLLVWALMVFNRLVRLRNQMRNAWADIDVQLARRHDLVPQLVAAVKGYASHEQAVLTAVTELRTAAMAQSSPARLYPIESELEQVLTRILALKEAYPELEASDNFLKLQAALVEVEDHLQYARRFYNGAVRDHNDAVLRVPDLLVARLFGFQEGEFYQAGAESRQSQRVRLQ